MRIKEIPTELFQAFAKRVVITFEIHELHKSFRILMEFGTDTLPGVHYTPPEMSTEEYQVDFIRRYLDVAERRPFVAGLHVWAFADFKTGQSCIRAGSMNFKGVFTGDRRPKMAAHFLRDAGRSNDALPMIRRGSRTTNQARSSARHPA